MATDVRGDLHVLTRHPRGDDDLRAASPAARRSAARAWLAERWPAVAVLAVAIPIACIAIAGTLYWPGRTFPGFFLLGNRIVPTIGVYDWTGLAAGVPFYARVCAVDGRAVTSNREVYDHVAALPIGTPVRYALVKDGVTLTRVVPTMAFTATHYWLTVGAFVAFGVLAIGASTLVFWLQPRTRAAHAFLSQGVFNGLYVLTGAALYHPGLWWLARPHLTTQALFSAAFIHLGLVFPETRPTVLRHPGLVRAPYVVAGLLTAWMMVDFFTDPPGLDAYYATSLFTGLAIATLVALVTHAAWQDRPRGVRRRLHVVLAGLLFGTALGLYGYWNVSGPAGNFPINLVVFGGPLFYLSIAYAIAKHDLFDIDTLVKQAAVYGTLTLVITAVYAASLAVLGTLIPAGLDPSRSSVTVAFIVIVAVVFQPLRAGAQRVVDRTFYRTRLDYRRTVSELSDALTSLLDLEEILSRVGRSVTDGLQLQSLAVGLWLDDGATLWSFDSESGRIVPQPWAAGAVLRDHLARAPGRPWYPARDETAPERASDRLLSAAREEASRLAAALVVPLAIRGQTIGAFVLGPRRSGRTFTHEDVQLLGTLAAQSAIAIQNARSYRSLQTLNDDLEAKVHSRTAALEASSAELATSNRELARAYDSLKAAQAQLLTTEKMASLGLVVAGVAHEINNPLSFIVGNVDPLRQTLAEIQGLAARHHDPRLSHEMDRLAKMLGLMALGAERTAAIVQDLRTFSRLGEAEPRPTDLHEAIEVSLRLLRPRWAGRITIHREYGSLRAVDVIPGQLNQVFMNVLSNACDAIHGRGNVWIRTQCTDTEITVAIRDDGSGITAEHLGRVFDPFFTTKPFGQGTGLGLAITQGIVANHGGTIRVETEVDRGTQLTISLPRIAGR